MSEANIRMQLRAAAYSLTGAAADYEPLMRLVKQARFVLLGEASHGTHEFYRQRAQLTKRLIQEYGFTAVAVEADWPDAYRMNRYVRGVSDDAESVEALASFQHFPIWMWRNADMLDFIGWLRTYNDALGQGATVEHWHRNCPSFFRYGNGPATSRTRPTGLAYMLCMTLCRRTRVLSCREISLLKECGTWHKIPTSTVK